MKKIMTEYTFENFIKGRSNETARRRIYEAALSPKGGPVSPVLVYGGAGVGKTHLLNAFINEYTRINAGASVLYLSAEEYVTELLESIKGSRTAEFRERMTSYDALVIDDLHCIYCKHTTQYEIFMLVDAYCNMGKPALLSAGTVLSGLDELVRCLRGKHPDARFVKIRKPGRKLKCRFAAREAEMLGLDASSGAVLRYVHSFGSEFNSIRGGLNKLSLIEDMKRKNNGCEA